MTTCKSCGKKGLFLKLFDGNCEECIKKMEIENQKKINAEKLSAHTYYNNLIQVYSQIGVSIEVDADPVARLSQIPLIEEKINMCDKLITLIRDYTSYPYLKDIILSNMSYRDEWSKKHGHGELKELSLKFYSISDDFMSVLTEQLVSNINRRKNNLIFYKNQIYKFADFQEKLDTLPKHLIEISSEKISKKSVSDLNGIKFSSITAKSNYERLGNFIVIDVETTGLSSTRDEIIEIAAICFEDWEPCEIFETFVKPKHFIPKEITDLTGITNEMVKNSPSIKEIIPALQKYIDSKSIIGHNLYFDMKFLYKNGLDFLCKKHKYYDTLDIAQKLLKKPKMKWDKEYECYDIDFDSYYDVEDHKLDTLCDYYQIRDSYSSHRAASDCLATGILFQHLVKEKISC